MVVSLFLLARGERQVVADARYGYGTPGGHRWVSAGLSLGIAAVVGSGLVLALVAPELVRTDPPFEGTLIEFDPLPPPPQPADPVDEPIIRTQTTITTTPPIVDLPTVFDGPGIRFDPQPWQPPTPYDGTGADAGGTAIPDPVPNPVMIGAIRDPRFAGAFQPPYPPALERERVEGSARVRVRIGVDGRVISVEDVSSTDPRFFAAAQRQALARWRFRPATRDGVAVESTQVLTVQFRMPTD